jgi:hypothetical protein
LQETTLPVDQVELLVMKALSQALVKGRIDEVTADRSQMPFMSSRFFSFFENP